MFFLNTSLLSSSKNAVPVSPSPSESIKHTHFSVFLILSNAVLIHAVLASFHHHNRLVKFSNISSILPVFTKVANNTILPIFISNSFATKYIKTNDKYT